MTNLTPPSASADNEFRDPDLKRAVALIINRDPLNAIDNLVTFIERYVAHHTKEAVRSARIDELGKWRNAIANSPNYIERKDTLEWMDKRLAGLSAPQQSTGGGDE